MVKTQDNQPILDMFSALGRDLKLPQVDVDAIIDHHRKNLEALQKSASASASGASALMARQREMLEAAVREVTAMTQNLGASNPQDALARQTDFMRRSFEAAVKNAGEVARIIQKSGTESVDILKQRIRESMDEIEAGTGMKK